MLISRQPSPLFEECIILYGKAGMHEQALNILVLRLDNHAGAEEYCVTHAPAEGYNTIFLELLKIYLKPASMQVVVDKTVSLLLEGSVQLEPALNILDRHASEIPAKEALLMLPSNIPVARLSNYFAQVVEHRTHNARHNMAIKNVAKAASLQTKCTLFEERGRSKTVGVDTVCGVCKKRLMNTVCLLTSGIFS